MALWQKENNKTNAETAAHFNITSAGAWDRAKSYYGSKDKKKQKNSKTYNKPPKFIDIPLESQSNGKVVLIICEAGQLRDVIKGAV
jgi:hypothetical protein